MGFNFNYRFNMSTFYKNINLDILKFSSGTCTLKCCEMVKLCLTYIFYSSVARNIKAKFKHAALMIL